MERSSLSDPKLGEVRAVLERLQTFAADPDSTQPPPEVSNGAALNGHATSAHKAGSPASGARAPVGDQPDTHESVANRRAPAAIGLGIAGAVVILLGVVWLIVSPGNRGELPAVATPDVTPAGRAISERSGGPALTGRRRCCARSLGEGAGAGRAQAAARLGIGRCCGRGLDAGAIL